MSFSQAVRNCLTIRYLDFYGRSSRAEFWWFYLASWLFYMIASLPFILLAASGLSSLSVIYAGALFVSLLLLLPASIGVAVRRLHDLDMSGWWLLGFMAAGLIPFIGFFAHLYLIYLFAKKGTSGSNRYGESTFGQDHLISAPAA